jgi:WD40 repeat protein
LAAQLKPLRPSSRPCAPRRPMPRRCAHSQGATGTVNDAAFTQDGRRLLAACGDKRIMTWNFASGQPGHTLTGHAGGVLCVAASALDAAVAVSAGEDRCVKVSRVGGGFVSWERVCKAGAQVARQG